MLRHLPVLLLLASCPCFSGCLGALLGATLAPRSAAAAMGSQVAYNVSSSLAGANLGEVVSQADTLANLDRILKEHPDAANRGELERLRQRLSEDLEAPADERLARDEADGWRDGHQHGPREPLRRPGYDRRSAGQERDPFADAIAGRPSRSAVMDGRFELEQPDHPDQRLRSRDPWRFSAVPAASELPRLQPGWSLIRFEGRQLR